MGHTIVRDVPEEVYGSLLLKRSSPGKTETGRRGSGMAGSRSAASDDDPLRNYRAFWRPM